MSSSPYPLPTNRHDWTPTPVYEVFTPRNRIGPGGGVVVGGNRGECLVGSQTREPPLTTLSPAPTGRLGVLTRTPRPTKSPSPSGTMTPQQK